VNIKRTLTQAEARSLLAQRPLARTGLTGAAGEYFVAAELSLRDMRVPAQRHALLRGQRRLDLLDQFGLRVRPDNRVHQLTVPEQSQRRDRHDGVKGGES
jgi:hypothetical protein